MEVALPRFDPVLLALPPSDAGLAFQSNVRQVHPSAEDIAASLPDLDHINLDALNQIHSLIPSVNRAEQEKQVFS